MYVCLVFTVTLHTPLASRVDVILLSLFPTTLSLDVSVQFFKKTEIMSKFLLSLVYGKLNSAGNFSQLRMCMLEYDHDLNVRSICCCECLRRNCVKYPVRLTCEHMHKVHQHQRIFNSFNSIQVALSLLFMTLTITRNIRVILNAFFLSTM